LSNFGTGEGVEVAAAAACEDDVEGAARVAGRLVTADFATSDPPFWTATEPKDLTPSAGFTAGADAGEEEIVAWASSIEPKVTAGDPCFTAFRGMPTPSFMETP
jgi:hypothetical protein